MTEIDLMQSICERLRQLAEDEAKRRAKLDAAYGSSDWQLKYGRAK